MQLSKTSENERFYICLIYNTLAITYGKQKHWFFYEYCKYLFTVPESEIYQNFVQAKLKKRTKQEFPLLLKCFMIPSFVFPSFVFP